ncbi:MAG: hypothetical protein KAI24_13200, partial [Planctomycetes bacterium]|nr:hypothetical protein [Planctomycetota bacterium]
MRRSLACLSACGLFAACLVRAPQRPIDEQLALAATALRQGRVEVARELVAEARERDPRHTGAAQWSALIADLLWRDDEAVRERMAAIRLARASGADELVAELRGQLGDQLFQSGRWGESSTPLLAGAIGEAAERRRAF